ncbi:Kinesin-like protein [Melia azedarach]|uniref:Kinesin-like protein n=1 Tax=Melia azedarach TaxID=155640 RepID=A0ACC1XCE6_MELAZ|nr:Kinesin-like protein [Melia azedarach]
MSVVGRQMSRSNTTAHHQRQYSDNFLDSSFSAKWLQSSNAPSSQDFGLYGGGRMGRKSSDPTTPPYCTRSSSLRKKVDDHVSPSELSPGLLDLHSFDTELLPQMPVTRAHEGYALHQPVYSKSFDDSEPYISTNKLTNRYRGMPENNLLKSFSGDKERANNVAKIKVVVRKRPLNKKEIAKKEEDIITIQPHANCLTVHETKLKVDLTEYVEKHDFVFDAVLSEDVTNDELYSETVEPIVPLIFQRTKATCFAYGQTGSGKTYTMQPLPLKACQDILRLMHQMHRNQGFQLYVSFFEIYGGKVFDLLNDRKKLCMREDGKQQVCIVGLQEYKVSHVETIKELIEKGNATRSIGTTGANEESSRSHAILQLAIKRSADGSESKPPRPVGKLSFIDLAGSERGADTTDNDKQTRMEGAEINKSLLALKECIRALDNDQGHIPFRGSKLTEVLRDSFVGDSRTVMISCISPSSGSCEHTLNTLRYADRVKSLSKGSSSRRDPVSSSSNLRDSTALPLSSVLPAKLISEDILIDVPNEKNRFGWANQIEREPSPPSNVDRVPSGRVEGNLPASVYSDYYKGQKGGQYDIMEDDHDYSLEIYEQEKGLQINNKFETDPMSALEDRRKTDVLKKRRDLPAFEANYSSDDDLNALLKEEEDLVSSHRKQVEETMELVREEMNLLVEADQPGNQLDVYISKLNSILSKKATGILQLQNRLAQFQRHLNKYNVLVSSSNN